MLESVSNQNSRQDTFPELVERFISIKHRHLQSKIHLQSGIHSERRRLSAVRLVNVVTLATFPIGIVPWGLLLAAELFQPVASGAVLLMMSAALLVFCSAAQAKKSTISLDRIEADLQTSETEIADLENELTRLGMVVPLNQREGLSLKHSNAPTICDVLRYFSYMLPRQLRKRVFAPAFSDLEADFFSARSLGGRGVRRWLAFAFTFQALLLILDCVRALILEKLAWMLPEPLRRWWLSGPKT